MLAYRRSVPFVFIALLFVAAAEVAGQGIDGDIDGDGDIDRCDFAGFVDCATGVSVRRSTS